jgi:hypothetical protein
VGGVIFSRSLLGISTGIVGTDPVKEIDICMHLAGPGCVEYYRLGITVKFVAKYRSAG